MHELSTELGRFIGGAITLDQLRAVFRAYLLQHPRERESLSHWLRNTVEEGRLSATVWLTLRDLFDPPATTLEPTAIPKPTVPARGQSPAQFETEYASAAIAGSESAHVRRPATAEPPLFAESPEVSCDTLLPQMVVKDRFVLVEKLGSGGMGQVFKARDRRREEAHDRQPFIALKVLNKEVSAHPESFMALQREARRASTLAHPNVVTVYDFDRDGGRIFMTMEYLEGRALDDFIDERCADGGLPLTEVLPIIRGVAAALEYGHHKRIVHCDLKPGNIFICKDGVVKVLDFGIARLIHPTDTRSEQTLFDPAQVLHGLTPAYASLEMWKQADPDPRDDIYALACVTYELLSGQHPFDRQSAKIAHERKLVPKRIEALSRAQWEGLKRGLALYRQDRTPSVSEFVNSFTPQSRLKRYAVPAAVAGALVTVAAVAVSARYYRVAVEDSTMEVLQCAQIPKPAALHADGSQAPPTAEQQREIEDHLTLAKDYLLDATPATRTEDLKYILSDGPNSVDDILNGVLRIHATDPQALQLKADVANLYAERARVLTGQQRITEALDLVRYGRQVLPSSQELFRLEQSICRMDALARNQN